MHFRANGTHAHRAGVEALQNRFDRFHLVDRNGGAIFGPEAEETPESHQLFGLVVDSLRVFAENIEAFLARRMLQQKDCLWVEQVRRAFTTPLILASDGETLVWLGVDLCRIGQFVPHPVFFFNNVEADPAENAGRAGEVLVDEVFRQPDCFKGLGPGIARHGGDAHLAHDFQNTLTECGNHITNGLLRLDSGDFSGSGEVLDGFHRQIGVERRRTKTDEQGGVVNLAHVTCFNHQADPHPLVSPDEVVVDR